MNKLLILSKNASEYSNIIKNAGLKQLEVYAFEDVTKTKTACDKLNIVLGDPDLLLQALPELDHLQWVQSTWAGVRPLVKKGCRKDYILTGVKNVFGSIMSEYIICYMLMNERKVLRRFASQQKKIWDTTTPGQLKNKSIGILGVGSIGMSIARTAKIFHMKTKGYSRNPVSCEFIDKGYGHGDSLLDFVRDLDYLVSVLPDTPATTNLLDESIFKAMKPQAILLNVGRGNVLDEAALVKAVNKGYISGAVLDVFKEEPLPKTHPFWNTPGIMITAHTAAMSFPKDIAPIFIENYRRFQLGKPLRYVVDLNLGY
ncbi:MAG: D-2-hydroxyacid dehydrogenase [Desulfobacula sp.]|nr:D-2-hydroxyacid dehydrogenase [Desulfobacula sp.]